MALPKNHLPSTTEWAQGLYTPAILLYYAVKYFIATIYTIAIVERRPLDLLRFRDVRDEAFSRFWLALNASQGSSVKEEELEGSAALVPPLLRQADGNVLEIGPGSGVTLPYINSNNISTYHAAEPAKGLHSQLNANAKRAGLKPGKTFHILPCGGEAATLVPGLHKAGLLPNQKLPHPVPEPIFDTIITIRVLCSVPSAKTTLDNLYALLRPGGKLIVVEHVVNPWTGPYGSTLARVLQKFYMLIGWSWFIGDCHLERDTEALLRRVGTSAEGADWSGWQDVMGGEGMQLSAWWGALPYISGVLVKR